MRARVIEQGLTEEYNTAGSLLSMEYLLELYFLTSKQSLPCLVHLLEATRPLTNSLNQLVQIRFFLYCSKTVEFLTSVASALCGKIA